MAGGSRNGKVRHELAVRAVPDATKCSLTITRVGGAEPRLVHPLYRSTPRSALHALFLGHPHIHFSLPITFTP